MPIMTTTLFSVKIFRRRVYSEMLRIDILQVLRSDLLECREALPGLRDEGAQPAAGVDSWCHPVARRCCLSGEWISNMLWCDKPTFWPVLRVPSVPQPRRLHTPHCPCRFVIRNSSSASRRVQQLRQGSLRIRQDCPLSGSSAVS